MKNKIFKVLTLLWMCFIFLMSNNPFFCKKFFIRLTILNKTIPKNTNTDNTIKGGTIANTGLETIIIIPIAIITVIGTVAFINYKRYKDI